MATGTAAVPQSIHQIYEAIDNVFDEYGERQIKRLINTTGLGTDEVHELRGKCQAARDLKSALKTQIGRSD